MSRLMRLMRPGTSRTIGRAEKKTLIYLGVLSLLISICSCTKKPSPSTPNGEGQKDTTRIEPSKPEFQEVTLMEAFEEQFSEKTSEIFDFSKKEADFRYFPAFPSWNERGTTLMLLRVDPSDPAGLSDCPRITSKEHTFYGSYSIRMRLPDIMPVQPNVGLNALFTINEQDSKNGYSTVEILWKLAEPASLYLNAVADIERSTFYIQNPVTNFDPSDKYYTYGFDWHREKLSWWVESGGERLVIASIDVNVPLFPSRLQFLVYHSKNHPPETNSSATQAPYYPYEFEIDAITYTPFEDEIEAWRNEYLK